MGLRVVLFAVYPVIVMVLVAHYRRRPLGLLFVVLSLLVLLLVQWAYGMMPQWTNGVVDSAIGGQLLLAPYTVLVPLAAAFMWIVPRRPQHGCVRCGYDLGGTIEETPVCPECGTDQRTVGRGSYRPSGAARPHLRSSDRTGPGSRGGSGSEAAGSGGSAGEGGRVGAGEGEAGGGLRGGGAGVSGGGPRQVRWRPRDEG